MTTLPVEDQVLLEQCRQGNQEAWTQLHEHFYPIVLHTLKRETHLCTRDRNVADELAERALEEFWLHLNRHPNESLRDPMAFLRGIAVRTFRHWWRARQRESRHFKEVDWNRVLDPCIPAELILLVQEFMERLPRQQKLYFRFLLGSALPEEIAHIRPNQRWQLNTILKKKWRRYCREQEAEFALGTQRMAAWLGV